VPISIVVGGQFGSEGKGKVAHFLVTERGAAAAVRVGGPNSGHTVYDVNGKKYIFQQLPTAAIARDVLCILGVGSYIDVPRLLYEVATSGLTVGRLRIDPAAVVLTEQHRMDEHSAGLRSDLGSTLTGTGAAVIGRVSRSGTARFARDEPSLAPYLCDTKALLNSLLDEGRRVVLEGTQGYGLSVFHTPCYPFATSRDTTAAGFLSEVGLSPLFVDEIVMVIRAFPIRVPGNSGPLDNECTWAEITRESGASSDLDELTSVTRTVRRVARFSSGIVRDAIAANRPTLVVLNHADYFDRACYRRDSLSAKADRAVREIESSIGVIIDIVGTGESHFCRRRHLELGAA